MPPITPTDRVASLRIDAPAQRGELHCALRSDVQVIPLFRALLDDLAELCAWPEKRRWALRQVSTEALTNAIVHGGSAQTQAWVELSFCCDSASGEITIVDSGPAFALEACELPEDESCSGRGQYIMLALCDSAELTRVEERNWLRLTLR